VSAGKALRAQAQALRAQADALEALASTLPDVAADELLDVAACRALGVGRDALRGAARRGELQVSQGPRGKLLVRRAALEAWLTSRSYKPTSAATPAPVDLAAWDRAMRKGAA
jgi:hypothetical protein